MTLEIINKSSPITIIAGIPGLDYIGLLDELLSMELVAKLVEEAALSKTNIPSYSEFVVHIHNNKPDFSIFTYDPTDETRSRRFLTIDISDNGIRPEHEELYKSSPDVDAIGITMGRPETIAGVIYNYYQKYFIDPSYSPKTTRKDYSNTLQDLLSRLDGAIEGIAAMRINSTGEAIEEMRHVSRSIRLKYAEREDGAIVEANELNNTVVKILTQLAKLYDVIENSKLAAIVISGATTTLMGATGLTATINLSVMLAAWYGKDAFLEAIQAISVSKSKPSRVRRKRS